MFDTYLIATMGGLAIGLLGLDFPAGKLFEQFYALGVIFAWVFIEATLLSSAGTTPGKWLFKVKVRTLGDEYPTFSTALSRSLKVWIRGLGLGIPLVAFFTQIVGHVNLTSNGFTSWDKEEGLVVIHERIGFVRVLLAIGALIGFAALAVYGTVKA